MPTILQGILDEFYKRLSATESFDEPTVQRLRDLFENDKKVGAADFVTALTGQEEQTQ